MIKSDSPLHKAGTIKSLSQTLTISFVLGASLSSVAKATDKNCSEIATLTPIRRCPTRP
jgi:hypothetical protein